MNETYFFNFQTLYFEIFKYLVRKKQRYLNGNVNLKVNLQKNPHLKKVEEAIQNVTKKCIHQKKFGFALFLLFDHF